jgi:hypothetical protein
MSESGYVRMRHLPSTSVRSWSRWLDWLPSLNPSYRLFFSLSFLSNSFNNGFINRVLILVLQMQPIHPAPHPRFNSLPRLRRRIHRRNRHHPSPPPTHRRPSHPSPYRRRPLSLQSSHHPPRCHYRLSIRELRALLRRRCSVGSQAFAR